MGETPIWVWVFLTGYFLVSLGLFLYGMHAYLMVALRRRVRPGPEAPSLPAALPRVTIQLPLYNERWVAARLLEAVTALRYPRDRLQIQVLDDSTDETAVHVETLVARLREEGWNIVQRRRTRRTGYKGGALREGLAEATGDLVAVFDADFIPPPDFLEVTVPRFADSGIGMVQGRWTHLNETYSPLTRAQAAALDGHFLIEQVVRNRGGAFINFNGTAGIWRKNCILDSGNWQDDTLTEDLDLSYRAQLRGWRFLFLDGLKCPAELPAEMNGLKTQQFRWAKGTAQTARKILPRMSRLPLPGFVKLEAAVHLTNHAVYPLLLLLGLAAFPSLWILERFPDTAFLFRIATVLVVASFGHPWLYYAAQRSLGKSRREALAMIPVVVAGNLGLAVNNTRALAEAAAGKSSPFQRTPKYALRGRSGGWKGKGYSVPATAWPLLELVFAVYLLASMVYAIDTARYLAVPFLALYAIGAAAMGWGSVWSAITRWRESAGIETTPFTAPATRGHAP